MSSKKKEWSLFTKKWTLHKKWTLFKRSGFSSKTWIPFKRGFFNGRSLQILQKELFNSKDSSNTKLTQNIFFIQSGLSWKKKGGPSAKKTRLDSSEKWFLLTRITFLVDWKVLFSFHQLATKIVWYIQIADSACMLLTESKEKTQFFSAKNYI